MSSRDHVNLSYRPITYWPESYDSATLLSRIKGKARRDIARLILLEQGISGLTAFIASENLNEKEREVWGKYSPRYMGGEYLPDIAADAVEIVRGSLRSTTFDQISVRAKSGPTSISYSVVDEYESEYMQPFKESDEPLTLGELILFLDSTENPGDISSGGLVQSHWNFLYSESGEIQEAIDFVSIESAHYPQLVEYYDLLAQEWIKEKEQEVEE